MTAYLTTLPTVMVVLVITLISAAGSLAGLLAVRRAIPHVVLSEHNDVAGFIFAGLGVIYAVVLAFVVIAVWESFDGDRALVNAEASNAMDLYRESAALDPEDHAAITSALATYITAVVEHEWPLMEEGDESADAERAMESLWAALRSVVPDRETQGAWYEAMIDSLKQLAALREVRLDAARESLPPVMGFVLLAGGVITVSYTYLYGVRNLYGQVAMTMALAVTIAITLSVVVILDSPFRGSTSVSPDAFEDVLRHMKEGVAD